MKSRVTLPLALVVSMLCATPHGTVLAQSLQPVTDPSGEDQCSATGISDSKQLVGDCAPKNGNGPEEAFFYQAGTTTALQPFVAGQSCAAAGIADSGAIAGACNNAAGTSFAMRWNASTLTAPPQQLAPLPGIAGLLADVASTETGHNQGGAIIGESVSSTGQQTAVVWPANATAATIVSSEDDNCVAVDVDNANASTPNIILDCPNSTGTVTPKIATPTGLLGAYVATALPLPSTASFCVVQGINEVADQMVGTCVAKAAPYLPAVAYWSSSTSTPQLLNVTVGGAPARSSGAFINDSGHIIFNEQTAIGVSNAGWWNPANGNNTYTAITPLTGGVRDAVTGFANNDLAAVTSEDGSENSEAARWTPTGGTVAEGFVNGGEASTATDVNLQGTAIVGDGQGSSENDNAAVDSSP
jgi:hypothetical protein